MNRFGNQLVIVYDNYTLKDDLTPAWGFSCLISLPQHRILFDTGGDPSILLKNMEGLDIDPLHINSVVLSHAHGDHVGGLLGLLAHGNADTLYVPQSFPDSFKESIRGMGPDVKDIGASVMIHPGVYSTGELGGGIKEQALVLKTCEGLVIITGCAHPGIIEIAEHARASFNEDIHLLIGGFHLMGYSHEALERMATRLNGLNVKRIAPCHCSGDQARAFFKQYYKDNYVTCAAGLTLALPDIRE